MDFTANRLPGYETNLFVEVKDYSGNANPVKEHKVTASIDLVQPRVLETTFGNDRANTLTVRFDKAVDAADKKYFTVKKGSDVIPVNNVVVADASNKIFYVSFFSTLEGTYDLKVKDVKDRTALQNTMVEYDGTFVAADVTNPDASNVDYNDSTRKLALHFGREMDITTLQNKGVYYIDFQKNGANTQRIAIPAEVRVDVVNGAKSVVLQFPEFINGTKVSFGTNGSVKGIHAIGLKSKTGQAVSWTSAGLGEAKQSKLEWKNAVQKDAKTFELEFNQVIAYASISDFTVNGAYPSEVKIDGAKSNIENKRRAFKWWNSYFVC